MCLGGRGQAAPSPPTPTPLKPKPSQFKGRPVYLPSPPAEPPEFPTLSVAKPIVKIVKCKTSTCSSREGPWLRRLLKALDEGIHQGSDRSVECAKTAEKGANDGSWAQKTARSKLAHQPSSSTQTRAENLCSPRPLPEAQHPPRLRQKRRMRENSSKRCKRRQLGPEDSEEQAQRPPCLSPKCLWPSQPDPTPGEPGTVSLFDAAGAQSCL